MCLKYSELIKMVRSANGSDVNSTGLEVVICNEILKIHIILINDYVALSYHYFLQ